MCSRVEESRRGMGKRCRCERGTVVTGSRVGSGNGSVVVCEWGGDQRRVEWETGGWGGGGGGGGGEGGEGGEEREEEGKWRSAGE